MEGTSQQNPNDHLVLLNGFPLLSQQYSCLFKKNLLLAWRNRRATFLQLFSSFFFIFLLFAIGKANESRLMKSERRKQETDPKALVSPPIPPCEDMVNVKLPCYDFIWSGSGSKKVAQIVAGIMGNNLGRPIPVDRTKSFATKEEVQKWLTRNPETCPGALHFAEKNATVITYGIETNSTKSTKRRQKQDPMFKFLIPLQLAAEREIARLLIGDSSFSWDVGLKEYAHPAYGGAPAADTDTGLEATFFLANAMFAFVFQISSLVVEKELKLRQAMNLMGLLDTAYWLSWLIWEFIMIILSSLMTVLFGMVFHLDFFIKNSFVIVFLVFFLFQLCLTGFAFMLSTFIHKASSANIVGFIIFIIGFATQVSPYEQVPKKWRALWSLFPPNLFNGALVLISDANVEPQDSGVNWSMRTKCIDGTTCILTLNDIYIRLGATFFLWLILAIYFDNVIPNPFGVRKPFLYFLNPGYWFGKGGNTVKEGGISSCFGSLPPLEPITPDDEDVLEEENNVKSQAREGSVDPNVAVQIHGLVKTYPGTTKGCWCCRCCCKRKKTPPFHAIRGLWLNFPKDQLFCLLGPNGAGKTTAINCLTGLTPVTSGDALIYGHSIRNSVGMTNIRKIIGFCPQFDILWESLTGQEHLELFANIKGLPSASIKSVVDKLIEEVQLTKSRNVRAGSYSGGMKRRLSVAAALIGNPKLVILDEPTSGMDPITRRYVWDIIENAKKGRAIVLTTHSMEEADILSDRIGIMAKGRLRCIGTTIRLKSRFGTGFVAAVSFNEMNDGTTANNQEAVKQFFKTHLDVVPKEVNKSFLTFVIPHDREELLTKFFRDLQYREREFGIADIQLGLATLEEVFLNIVKQAELENALADGSSMATLTLSSNISIQIPFGARFVKIPGTESPENPQGLMVAVYWQQDDSGTLCISGHSPETPIPPHVQQLTPFNGHGHGGSYNQRATSHLGVSGRSGLVQGIVLDPDQIIGSHSH